jgi:trigger factor
MQVSLETLEGLERRLLISINSEKLDNLVHDKLRREAKRARIDGFRPGKVPTSIIDKKYGTTIRKEASDELMQRLFFDAIISEKLNPAGMPALIPMDQASELFRFEAKFEVYPEIELKDVADIEIEKISSEVTDADVENMLSKLLDQHAEYNAVERAPRDGDKVVIDFDGFLGEERFEGGKSEGFELLLGSNQMIPGFESEIISKGSDKTFSIDVKFPEDYHAENLKGKEAKFVIVLHQVQEKILPEMNEDFFAKFNMSENTLEALKSEIRKNMERETSQVLSKKFKEEVMKKLLDANQFVVPKVLIDQEISTMRQQAQERFQGSQQFDLPSELFQEQAEKSVRTGLILGEIIKKHDIKVNAEKVDQYIDSVADSYEDPASVKAYYAESKEMMQQAKNLTIENQAVDLIASAAKVLDKRLSFDELISANGA